MIFALCQKLVIETGDYETRLKLDNRINFLDDVTSLASRFDDEHAGVLCERIEIKSRSITSRLLGRLCQCVRGYLQKEAQ